MKTAKKKIYQPYPSKVITKVNDKLCALQLGQNILFNENDTFVKTVIDISINIDGSVKYHLKWFDGYGIKDVWLNENEISAFEIVIDHDDTNIEKHETIGFQKEINNE